jgi:adenylate cyclase
MALVIRRRGVWNSAAMANVFISCASASKPAAERIARALRAMGHEVWRDDALPPHRAYADVIEERLHEAKAVVVVWSKAAAQSQWVRAEADVARQGNKLVQLTVDGAPLPLPFNQIQCADLSQWRGDPNHADWRKVVASVAELVGGPPPAPATPGKARPRPWAWAAAALVLGACIAGGVWALRDRLPFAAKPAERVAVLPFNVEGGDASLQGFADGLADETVGALSSDHVQALSRLDSIAMRGALAEQTAKRLGVALFLDGAISKVDDKIKVRLYLNDAREHTTLWSKDFERPVAEADAMQAQIAARAADIAHTALVAYNKGGGALDAATAADFIEAMDETSNEGDRPETLLRRVISKAPKFSAAYSLLAVKLGRAPGQSIADLLAARRALARRALELDPHNGEADMFLANVSPMGAWAARESLFSKGAAADPTSAPLFHFQSKFFGQVGRFGDALVAAEKTAALNDMFVGGGVDACIRLTHVGRFNDARPICERADRLWPRHEYNDRNQFFLELENGRERQALERLQHPDLRENWPETDPAAWTAFLTARAAGDAAGARAAALATAKAADAGKADRRIAYVQLAMTGEVDAALAQGQAYYNAQWRMRLAADDYGDSSLLFVPATAAVRRDPRFMALAAQLGLVEYWRASGKWPDFCAQPGLPYDCRAEAARLKPSKN